MLMIGDILLGFGINTKVKEIIEHIGQFIVYDFTIGDYHTFIAENLIVHNMATYAVIAKMASGGYTGSWDGADTEANGKLAFLH